MTCDASARQIRPPEVPRQHEVQRRSRSVSAKRYEHLFPKTSVHPLQLDVTDEKTFLSAVRAHLSTREGAYKRFAHLVQRMRNASAKSRKDFGFNETFKRIVAILGNNMELVRHLHFILPTCYLFQVQKDAIIVKVRRMCDWSANFLCIFITSKFHSLEQQEQSL